MLFFPKSIYGSCDLRIKIPEANFIGLGSTPLIPFS